jgi:4'-phosphopantetheinyl transferase
VNEPFIDVWVVGLSDAVVADDAALLGRDERDRAARFRRAVDAAHYVAGRAAVRRVLARYLGCAAGEVRLGRAPCPRCRSEVHGPPTVTAPTSPVRFNASRSGTTALVAVTNMPTVGVDVEVAGDVDVVGLANSCLTADERHYVLGCEDRAAAFYRAWTRKEAVLKAIGVGIAGDLRGVDVYPDRPGPVDVSTSALGAGSWWLTDLDIGSGVVASVAHRDVDASITVLRADP